MTGMSYADVWEVLPLCDAYGLHHQSMVASGHATDWPQRRAAQQAEAAEVMKGLFGEIDD